METQNKAHLPLWLRLSTRQLGTIAGALLLLGVVCAALTWALGSYTHATLLKVTQHREAAARLLSDVKDLETGERGFVITAQPDYLVPYTTAEAALDGDIAALSAHGITETDVLLAVAGKRRFAAHVIQTEHTVGREAARALILSGVDKAELR